MQYTDSNIIPMIIQACEMFIKNDSYLLTKEVNERSLTHRLAVYLESLLIVNIINYEMIQREFIFHVNMKKIEKLTT